VNAVPLRKQTKLCGHLQQNANEEFDLTNEKINYKMKSH